MQIIPVIDLKNGIVVHAKHGDRKNYAPLVSRLCQTSKALDVADAFIKIFNATTLYIADLDAITGQGDNLGLIADLMSAFPQITFWLDCGYPLPDFATLPFNNYVPVIGSESLTDENCHKLGKLNQRFILSLDFGHNGQMGAKKLFTNPTYWPGQIILMALAKVGSNQGPDIELLRRYTDAYPAANFIAAGGIRHNLDLSVLEELGIKHCLVASALHNGKLNPPKMPDF